MSPPAFYSPPFGGGAGGEAFWGRGFLGVRPLPQNVILTINLMPSLCAVGRYL